MLLIADTSPIISLLLIHKFDLLEHLFPGFLIPQAVWEELQAHQEIRVYQPELSRLSSQVRTVSYHFSISGIDRGETEAILLYQELHADYLLLDDHKVREKAELFDIKCIGTLGVLYRARQQGLIPELRSVFQELLHHNRYYAKKYLNLFLRQFREQPF